MSNPTIGFIGYGNMAQAIAEGLLRSKALEPEPSTVPTSWLAPRITTSWKRPR